MWNARRRVLLFGASTLLSVPRVLFAQVTSKMRRIGFLSLDTADSIAGRQALQVFPEALDRLGYKSSANLTIEWRWANGKPENLSGLAEDLVRMKVEIIVARTNASIQAAMEATKTIPIVMLNGNFPVESKLIESLARPGGNVTGTSYIPLSTLGKAIQLIKELAPRTTRIAIPWNANTLGSPIGTLMQETLLRAANALGILVEFFNFRLPDEVQTVLNNIAKSASNAFFFLGDPVSRTRTAEIMAFLRDHKMASISLIPTFAEIGGLAHYAPDTLIFYERTASYVDRILKGARPADLPVEEPTRYEFVVNLKTAKSLGLKISQSTLARADRIVE